MFCLLWCFPAARRWIRRRLGPVLLAVVIAFGLAWGSEASAATVNFNSTRWQAVNGGTGCNSGFVCTAEQACLAYKQSWLPGYTQLLRIDLDSSPRYPYKTSGTCIAGKADGSGAYGMSAIGSDTVYGGSPMDCTSASNMNKYVGAFVVGGGSTPPTYACIQGCQYPQGKIAVGLPSSYGMEVGKGNGQTCNAANYDSIDTTTKPSDPPSPVSCAQLGLVYGTVNGVGICAKGGEIPGTSVTKNDSPSTTQATDASGVQAVPQTTNTTTNITNVNGVPTVTKTTTNPDGSKTTTTQDKDVYCASNPNDALCKTDSQASGGDDCKTPPVCKGDAIQCAMLNQQWHTRCDDQQTNSASDLATQVLAGNDPSKNPADHANRDVRPISNSLDQTAFLGGGGLQDKVVTVSGQSITLPFSRLNQYLEWIGRLFVVLSLIGALRIVLGGFKK